MAEDMFSGWGIRTLSSESQSYNPTSSHLGTVWPHANSMIPAGFKNYGLSYLDSQNKDSLTDCPIILPTPAGFTQGFCNMKFSCLRNPESGELPAGGRF